MSGFFLIRRAHLDGFQTSVKGFKIGLELFVRSQPRRLAEVGYAFVGRTLGESKMSVAEGTGFLQQLVSLYRDALAAPVRRPACVTIAAGQERAASAVAVGRLAAARGVHSEPPPSTQSRRAPAAVLNPYEMRAFERGDRGRGRQVDAERQQPGDQSSLDRAESGDCRHDAAQHREHRTASRSASAAARRRTRASTHVRRRKSWSHSSDE